jgi:hypothetical protein
MNLLATNLRNQFERKFDVDKNIVFTSVKKEVNLNSLHHQEERVMTNIFHIKIQVNKTFTQLWFTK